MSQPTADQDSFASGRYSKRKRSQVVYCLGELEVNRFKPDYETPQLNKQKATTTPNSLPKRAIFPFLELPAEIRNAIYEYALTDPLGLCFVRATKHGRHIVARVSPKTMAESINNSESDYYNRLIKAGDETATLVPSLLGVSKQILHESHDILYSNELMFEDTSAMYSFLISVGPTGALLLKTMTLLGFLHGPSSKGYNHECFAVLARATNLQKLTVDTYRGWYRSGQKSAQQMYRDGFPWSEAVDNTQRKVDAAFDILCMNDERFEYFYSGKPGNLEEFRGHLSRLLWAQRERVTGCSVKKRKSGKGMGAEEL